MIYLIANEKHVTGKNAKKLDIVRGVFDRAGKKYEVLLTHKAGDAKAYAEKITSDGEKNILVSIGGDGTLHEILNGFKDFENNSLGLIPIGTGNDFAASAEIPLDAKQAAEIIAFREPERIDFIEFSSGLRSMNIVGMGIDVDVLKRVYEKNLTGKSKYAKALASILLHFKSQKFTLKYNDTEEELYGLICTVCNGKQLGGGMKINPQAKINDGCIELFVCDFISKWRIIGMFLKLMTGRVHKIKEARSIKVKSVTIIPHADEYLLQADGELYNNIPFEASVVPGKLKFYLPANNKD